ncbi:MAG: class I SAM-dependent methyltransferase [Hyphomicrobiales bacterium]
MNWKSQLSSDEWAQKDRFEATYLRGQLPVFIAIEKRVCGCDYGGDSWTTQPEAIEMIDSLRLTPSKSFLDLGAGAGWPGVYMARLSGCNAVLVDLPLAGLCIASERAALDGISERVRCICADAAALPLSDGGFDAISHSDLLCCLEQKRAVLTECRRVISDGGKMAFTVIFVAPGLSERDYELAVENGPEFIRSDEPYDVLLSSTGWKVEERKDITSQFSDSICRQIEADDAHEHELCAAIGADVLKERMDGWRTKLPVIEARLIRREFFIVSAD